MARSSSRDCRRRSASSAGGKTCARRARNFSPVTASGRERCRGAACCALHYPLHSGAFGTRDRAVRAAAAAAAAAVAVLLAGCMPPPGGRAMGGPVSEPSAPRYINPGTLAALDGFTHSVKVGLTIYVSGELALDSTGQLVGPGDLRAQARQAFANLAQVLRIAGALPSDVTKLSIYVVNYRPEDFDLIREAGAEFFPQRNPPAGLVLGVQSLPKEGLLIAVDATAVVRAMFPERRPEGRYPRD